MEFDNYVFNVKKFNNKKVSNFRTQISVNLQEKILDKFFEKRKCLSNQKIYYEENDKQEFLRRNKKTRFKMDTKDYVKNLKIDTDNSRLYSIREDLLNSMINSKAIVMHSLKKNSAESKKEIKYPDNYVPYGYLTEKMSIYSHERKHKDITKGLQDVVDRHMHIMKSEKKNFFINSLGLDKYQLYFVTTRSSAMRNLIQPKYVKDDSLKNENASEEDIENLIFKNYTSKYKKKYHKIKKSIKNVKLITEKLQINKCNLKFMDKLMKDRSTNMIYVNKNERGMAKKCVDLIQKNKDEYLANKTNLYSYKSSFGDALKLNLGETLILNQYFFLKVYNLAFKIALFLIRQDVNLRMLFDFCTSRSYYWCLFNFQQWFHKAWNHAKKSDVPFYFFLTSHMLVKYDLDKTSLTLYPPLLFDLLVVRGGSVSELLREQEEDKYTIRRMELIEKKLEYAFRRQELKSMNYSIYEMSLLIVLRYTLREYAKVIKGEGTEKFLTQFEELVKGLQYYKFSLKHKNLAHTIYNKICKKTILRMTKLFFIHFNKKRSKEECKTMLIRLTNFFDFDINDLRIILSKQKF
mmetsp:Transcript_18936/g.36398  ORF Transcript_18936/g.36398 Transcript_18936/m.36398 type:complete len:576 (-) Transcript_18936:13-1740(-)